MIMPMAIIMVLGIITHTTYDNSIDGNNNGDYG